MGSFQRERSKTDKVTMVLAGAATGSSALLTAALDMAGFEGVYFVGRFLTANAGNFASVSQSATSGGSYAALANTKVTPGDNGDSFMIDIKRPPSAKPFLKVNIVRAGADTVTGDVYAVQYGSRKSNPGHGATIDAETHVDPVEGSI